MNTEMTYGSSSPQPPPLIATDQLVNECLVLWYFIAALSYLILSMLGGLLMALQLVHWNPLKGIELSRLAAGAWSIPTPSPMVSWPTRSWARCTGPFRG